jgi:hypothetical protein
MFEMLNGLQEKIVKGKENMVDSMYTLKQLYVQMWRTFLTCDLSHKCMGV